MAMVIIRRSYFSLFLFYRVGAHSFPVLRYISISVVWSTVHILQRARLFIFSRIGMIILCQTANTKVFSNSQKTSEIILVYLKKERKLNHFESQNSMMQISFHLNFLHQDVKQVFMHRPNKKNCFAALILFMNFLIDGQISSFCRDQSEAEGKKPICYNNSLNLCKTLRKYLFRHAKGKSMVNFYIVNALGQNLANSESYSEIVVRGQIL